MDIVDAIVIYTKRTSIFASTPITDTWRIIIDNSRGTMSTCAICIVCLGGSGSEAIIVGSPSIITAWRSTTLAEPSIIYTRRFITSGRRGSTACTIESLWSTTILFVDIVTAEDDAGDAIT